jgi:hypothetical protein
MIRNFDELKGGIIGGHFGPGDADIPRVLLREVELLREVVWDLMTKVKNAPCLASYPGENTYHCNAERVCRVCEWRDEVGEMLHQEWSLEDGLWVHLEDIKDLRKKEEK